MKRVRIAVFAVAVGLAVLAGITFFHPLHAVRRVSQEEQWHFTIREGNARLSCFRAAFDQSFIDESPLDAVVERYHEFPPPRWEFRRYETFLDDGTLCGRVEISMTLFAPLVGCVAYILVRRAPRAFRGRLVGPLGEIIRPSMDGGGFLRRCVRRTTVTVFVFGLGVTTSLWLVSVLGPWRRAQEHMRGHCIHCGYDLTGNVSGVCPECGTGI